MLLTARYVASKNAFEYTIVSDLDRDLDKLVVEITEHKFDKTSDAHEWQQVTPVEKVPAGQAVRMPDYKKSWYCDNIQNCFIRFTLKDADGKVVA